MLKFLFDECLSTALVKTAQCAGYQADHVVWMGWSGLPDWSLMPLIERNDYLFVTNNRADFLRLHARIELPCGLIILVPNVDRAAQVALFEWALPRLPNPPDLINTVVEIFDDGPSMSVRNHAAP